MWKDLNEIFSFERKQFLLSGLYPMSGKRSLVHTLRAIVIFVFSMLLPISMSIKLVIGVASLEEFADILYYLCTQTAYICKLLNFLFGPGKILEMEEMLRQPHQYEYYKIYGWHHLQGITKLCDYLARIFRFLIIIICILYAILPAIDSNRDLPFSGWFPVDRSKYKWYIYVLQLMCVAISAATNGNMDIFAIYLISIGVGKLKILKECLRHVDFSKRNFLLAEHQDEKAFYYENSELAEDKTMSPDRLKDLYLFHEHVVTYISMVENAFSYGIFVQFLASVVVICLSGFQMMITPPESAMFVLLLFYMSCMTCQVAMYCWYGNEILSESETLGDACYMSNWYEGNPADRKFIFIFMERCKRVTRLTAGKFFNLSIATLLVILKSSYSYFAVLQRLYKE